MQKMYQIFLFINHYYGCYDFISSHWISYKSCIHLPGQLLMKPGRIIFQQFLYIYKNPPHVC